ncbi:MAG: hypothetical protein H6577_06395 [Lewinellaceae bacterium]|nr:hypothetical protein [Saprospiraceae bacterium]MCB9337737.1 hypothetical protein [Lewinellaceae bacterium]
MKNRLAAGAFFLAASFLPLQATAPVAASFSLDEYWKTELLDMVKKLRATGCQCGNKYMPPAPPLQWNRQLEHMAFNHTSDMRRHRFMGHYSSTGIGIAGRAKAVGYHYIAAGKCGRGLCIHSTGVYGLAQKPRPLPQHDAGRVPGNGGCLDGRLLGAGVR